jgi:hypothetical protein
MSTRNRSYAELSQLQTFKERYEYLALRGEVGCVTFGSNRWMNQQFYTSREWRQLRQKIILRDHGCDLGVEGFEIHDRLIVHHMNPLDENDIAWGTAYALNPEFLISTTHATHNAIHYGDASLLTKVYIPRRPGDTKLW